MEGLNGLLGGSFSNSILPSFDHSLISVRARSAGAGTLVVSPAPALVAKRKIGPDERGASSGKAGKPAGFEPATI
jgi:hypothetical protein